MKKPIKPLAELLDSVRDIEGFLRKECHVRFDASVGVHSQSLGHRHGSAGLSKCSPQVSAIRPRHPLRARFVGAL